jgi:ribosome-interacting GTPase 1
MSKLTGTHSEVSEVEFTTLTTVPGTLKVHGAPIQILDLRWYDPSFAKQNLTSIQLVSLKVHKRVVVVVVKVSQHASYI